MVALKRMLRVLKRTGTIKIFFVYLAVLGIGGLVLRFIEPGIHGFFEGVYYCFIASSTVGFGDIVPVTRLGRIITVFVTMAGILTVAMVPGVIVSYYTEYLKSKEQETVSTFLEKLEKLPEMSREELEKLSERVKQYNRKK